MRTPGVLQGVLQTAPVRRSAYLRQRWRVTRKSWHWQRLACLAQWRAAAGDGRWGKVQASGVQCRTGGLSCGGPSVVRPLAGERSWFVAGPCERGDAMVVWCLLLAMLLLPLAGISVDLWHGIEVQRQLQSVAEDAANAGASGINIALYREDGCIALDPSMAVTLAQANLESQANLGPLSQVAIEVAPNDSTVTVALSEDVHLTLLSLVQKGPLVVRAVATSEPRGSEPADVCNPKTGEEPH
jgi:hypothetical protein